MSCGRVLAEARQDALTHLPQLQEGLVAELIYIQLEFAIITLLLRVSLRATKRVGA